MRKNIKTIIIQISKFAVVGFINTGIDFAVLNLLMWMTGIYGGKWIILLNAIAFTTAVINSYFMNKFWTFKSKEEGELETEKVGKEFSSFLAVSITGIIINTALVYFVTTFVPPMCGVSEAIWANAAKITATCISLAWNFIGYKFLVFKD